MLQKTYSIYSDDLVNQQLFIEVGKNHLACWCKKANENKFTAFEFFQCDNYDASAFEHLINQAKLYSKLLTVDVTDTTLLWFNAENIIIPAVFNTDENFIMENFSLMYGYNDGVKLISNNYQEFLIVTSIEKYLYNAALHIFPKANFKSACSFNNVDKGSSIRLFFYPCYFSLIVFKEGTLQYFQTKYYNAPQDVLYDVLNVLQQYGIEKHTEIITGGFIDEHSKLFELLHQYLEGLKPEAVDETLFVSSQFKEYPAHYFLPYANYLQ